MTPINLTILGATGTIGVNTLDVVARHPERFSIVALTGATQLDKLAEQCRQFRPRYAVVMDAERAATLKTLLAGLDIEVRWGVEALEEVSALPEVDSVMAAIVGAAGLRPAMAAARAGKRILLANKETLVMAGHFFMEAVKAGGASLLPIDSEHNAVFQSMPAGYDGNLAGHGVRRILLTASGGPFRSRAVETLAAVTPEEAVAHPTWVMGKKISVDSATMMNKGLEVIEARWLFNARPEQIEVVIHPQSIIHSMVEYLDGSVLAQLYTPDMRTPIAHSLAYPERVAAGVPWLDLAKIGTLTFEAPDFQRFPCLKLAYQALATGGAAPAILNAANEEAVAAFLDHRIPYLAISETLSTVLARLHDRPAGNLEELEAVDAEARNIAQALIAAL
ncbi:MAG: 1-deoxy-D-xylulose-5-phosphate reductoisomerase [Hydrogenophilales bacterium]|nr:1-deoxy-D-xylulose-5-phosphate reductoisomerase [Hydrogenophilales bacterium]